MTFKTKKYQPITDELDSQNPPKGSGFPVMTEIVRKYTVEHRKIKAKITSIEQSYAHEWCDFGEGYLEASQMSQFDFATITLRVMGRINIDPFIENFGNEIEVIIPVKGTDITELS